ncbi:hypothetical protein ERJ75_001001800 [Trypanosoma vivax]|uniref:C2 domain-containing protein n=1 Tax=Trypanosoma vivax (strain Y486) TaxID=1055687 RepID=G0UAY3_TRYVY|nr:hypothetical protein TRVL_02185 [Trypanosoma vivax]KAH8611263.1 hypothetical protein ERJ75_001001800 [Trypanosoma vivax]CCC52970.1 conserved hypothetical protein [Trypanosoma vivax Y486]
MGEVLQLHVDVLRGRHYPQTEDDPCACSTFVRLLLYDNILKKMVAEPFETVLHEGTNAPFYNQGANFDIPAGMETVMFVVEVVETTRRPAPYVMFYGCHRIVTMAKGKREDTIVLVETNPVQFLERAQEEALRVVGDGLPCPVLSIRYYMQRQKNAEDEEVDEHADAILKQAPSLDGQCPLVPKDSQYVWVNFVCDQRWTESFHNALVQEWRKRPPIQYGKGTAAAGPQPKEAPKGTPNSKVKAVKDSAAPDPSISDIRDVVLKVWNCRRSHEVLTRLRLCGEAFCRGEKSLYFTRERELSFRLQRKERVYLIQEMVLSSLKVVGSSALRDVLDCLWIFYVTGQKRSPSDERVLSYEVRKRLKETAFGEGDKTILTSCFLQFLIPLLTQEDCDDIAAADTTAVTGGASPNDILNSIQSQPAGTLEASPGEMAFALALMESVGAMLDTITETEVVHALKAFEPVVFNAHKRIQKGENRAINQKPTPNSATWRSKASYKPGDGIKIDHLDRLGHRKKSAQPR